jgi:hypothetical protein
LSTGKAKERGTDAMKRSPEIACILAWLVPGLGHLYIGKRLKAAVLGLTLILAFSVGALTSGRGAVSVKEHGYAFLAQVGAGGPAFATLALSSHLREPKEDARKVDPLVDIGFLYTMVVGLLNIVVIFDAFETALKEKKSRAD